MPPDPGAVQTTTAFDDCRQVVRGKVQLLHLKMRILLIRNLPFPEATG
jgi:hypothetical protein